MIETLILGIIAVTAAAITGYFYGESKSKYLHIKKNGWEVTTCESIAMSEIFFHAKKGGKSCLAVLDPAKDKIDWFIKDVVDE
jgi:predicted nucleic-acid-binding Zn-ribbon protein